MGLKGSLDYYMAIPSSIIMMDLRHTHAISLVEADILTIKEMLSHASVTTTEIYVKTAPLKKKAEAVNSILNVIFKGEEPV